MSYSTYRAGAILLLMIYFIVSKLIEYNHIKGGEFYPFFSWNLFSQIPNTVPQYTARIKMYNGQILKKPIWFVDAQNFVSTSYNVPVKQTENLRELGEAIENHNEQLVKIKRREFEINFIKHPVWYDILKIKARPADFWRSRQVQNETTLASFETK